MLFLAPATPILFFYNTPTPALSKPQHLGHLGEEKGRQVAVRAAGEPPEDGRGVRLHRAHFDVLPAETSRLEQESEAPS